MRRFARISCILLQVALLLGPPWAGYVQGQTPQGPEPPSQTATPDKPPPPPLFPKHRRGIYKNNDNIEVIDATPQSPPLSVDDPGVPDKGAYEINLMTDADLSAGEHELNLLFLDANYGVLPKIMGHELPTQLKFEMPFSGARAGGEPFAFGVGGMAFGLKFNFYDDDHTGVSLALYPQLEFSPSGSARKGLAEAGQTLVLPLLMAKQLSHATLVINGGIEQPFHDPERNISATYGVGLGRALMRKFAVMADLHGESARSHRELAWDAGLMYGVRHIPVYARIGRSIVSDGGERHTYVVVGIKLISKPMLGGG